MSDKPRTVMEGTPEVIYLQTGDAGDEDMTFDQLGDVTWADDWIDRGDTKYIRADIAERELSAAKVEAFELSLNPDIAEYAALRAEAERLRKALEQAHDAMEAFTDPEGNMPADTGEFRELKAAMLSIRPLLGVPK